MKAKTFMQLEAWQKSHSLTLEVYRLTRGFPSEERFALVPQMRRAAMSIPANIAEGFCRMGTADKIRFYNIAQTSAEELKYSFILCCRDLDHLPDSQLPWALMGQSCRLIAGLIRSMRG